MTRPRDEEDSRRGRLATGGAPLPNPEEVNEFHRYDDLDNSPESHHHTLGIDPNQSSPGDHNHDGRNSKLISALEKYLDKVTTAAQTVAGMVFFSSRIRVDQGINFIDTRTTNPTPTEIPQGAISFDFKPSSVMGLNTLLGTDSWTGVLSVAPWGDDTGGGTYQLAFATPATGTVYLYVRRGSRAGGWGPWAAV